MDDITRSGLRVVNRQKGSGTRIRLDSYLRKQNINPRSICGYENEETTHYGVAYRVANGEADAGIGVQAAAERLGLGFVPLFKERYDLICLGHNTETQWWNKLCSILRSQSFKTAAEKQGGYDAIQSGTILWPQISRDKPEI